MSVLSFGNSSILTFFLSNSRFPSKLLFKKITLGNIWYWKMTAFRTEHSLFVAFAFAMDFIRDLIVDGCQSNLFVMLKQLSFFIRFITSFVSGILWWTDRVIIISIYATQQLLKLKKGDFYSFKTSRVGSWYYFLVIKRYTFHY